MGSKGRPAYVPTVDLGKFVYCWFIVYFHFYLKDPARFGGGKYAVEFFVLAAGVFFFQKLDKKADSPAKAICRRFFRFFPWALTGYVFALLVIRLAIDHASLRQVVKLLSGDVWEILLVKMNGMNNGQGLLNSPAWTLSSMLLAETLLILCFGFCRKASVGVLLPASLILGFGYWGVTDRLGVSNWLGLVTFGTFRVWLIYCCAYYCFQLCVRLRRVPFNRRGALALTALEIFCHLTAVLVMLHEKPSRYWQWCALLFFFTAAAIEMSGRSLLDAALQKCARLTRFLGAVSMSVYLVHWPVIRYFQYLYPDTGAFYAHVGAATLAISLCALGHYFVTTGLIRLWRAAAPKLAAVFIRSKNTCGV